MNVTLTHKIMTPSELAEAMLRWERWRNQLDNLEYDIRETVLAMGKTQTVGNVRASYSGGRRKFDYQTPGADAPVTLIAEYTKTEVVTDWKAVCEKAGIEPICVEQSEPSVIIKLVS